MKKIFPASFYNPFTLAGAAIASVSFGLIIFLILIETLAHRQKPYMGIVAFVIMPAFLILGLSLVAVGVIREYLHGRRGKSTGISLPTIDLNNPGHRVAFMVFSVGTILLLMFTAFGSYKAYEYTDSDEFCGVACHKVMAPEYTAYRVSPHARVGCVECHIGSGADWFVRSKISGTYQLYATIFNTYPRPVPTPVKNLRPAQETCEQCHWPRYFISEKLKVNTYFLPDDVNARWTVAMLMKIGGGAMETGPTSGIHWHMNVVNEVTYVAADPQRLVIPWIRVRTPDGRERVYLSTEGAAKGKDDVRGAERRMDCIDCHNRPTHVFHHPAQSVNLLMSLGRIDPGLPNIKSVAVKTLEQGYSSSDHALDEIRREIEGFYRRNYPAVVSAKGKEIERAVGELQDVYRRNYFPSMRVSWDRFPDHIGHLYSPGCFRCHDGKHVSDDGKVVSKDCTICHLIVAQQFQKEDQRLSLTGLEYRHPVDIGGSWRDVNCSECHGAAAEEKPKGPAAMRQQR